MYDTKIEMVNVECLDLDFERYYDMSRGQGIRIDTVEAYDAKKRKNKHGLQSEFWGTDFGDEYAFQERYSCECHKYTSKHYFGMVCDACGTRVEYREPDVTKTGWIILDHNRKLISPIFAMKLSAALGKIEGKAVLDRILKSPYRKSDGEEEQAELREKELKELKIHPFLGKGMTWLVQNIDTVLDYYAKRKPTKAAAFEELKANKSIMFTSGIPVFSSILRIELPGVKNEKLFKMKVNTHYQAIIQTTNKVNTYTLQDSENDEKIQVQIDKLLASAQHEIEELFEAIFKILDGKHGFIQSKCIGGRYDWCSRNIITPDSGVLRANEVEISYIAMLELFRYEICNAYCKLMGVNMAKANQVWTQAKNYFNSTIYAIMDRMIKKDQPFINLMINRNPSLGGSYR